MQYSIEESALIGGLIAEYFSRAQEQVFQWRCAWHTGGPTNTCWMAG